MTLTEEIDTATDGAYSNFRLRSMRYDLRTGECIVSVNYAPVEGQDAKAFEAEALKILPPDIRYIFRYARVSNAPEDVAMRTRALLDARLNIRTEPKDVAVDGSTVTVTLDTIDCHTATDSGIAAVLERELDEEFCRAFSVGIVERVKPVDADALRASLDAFGAAQAHPEADSAKREIAVTKIEKYIGDIVTGPAMYIADCKADETVKVVLCGKISDFRIMEKPSSKNPEKTVRMVRFRLTDPTGTIAVFTFSSEANFPKWSALAQDSAVIAEGTVGLSFRGDATEFHVTRLSYCELPETFEEVVRHMPEPPAYKRLRPVPFVTRRQSDLFTVEERPDPYFEGKTFVVFDTETTGTKYTDRIVEIALVRLVNGYITESMQTLVDPEMPIHPSATAVNHITDDMVVGAPKWEEVVADVYKFCYGATLVGHNVAFDIGMLKNTSRNTPYTFDNPSEDTLAIVQRKVHEARNYKLATLIKMFGIVNDNAHRALADTVATARLFLKLIALP